MSTPTISSAVLLTKVGRVALITINRPKKLNALTSEVADAFGSIITQLVHDPSEYGCAVITGAGRAFSAGGDLDWLRLRTIDTPSRNSKIMHDFYNKFLWVREIPIPVVCAINGAAIGAGFCFAMACDIRIVAEKAKLGFTFVGLGLHPGMGATHLIAGVAGMEVAINAAYRHHIRRRRKGASISLTDCARRRFLQKGCHGIGRAYCVASTSCSKGHSSLIAYKTR